MDNQNLEPGLEKFVYSSFHNTFVTWRQGNIGTKLIIVDEHLQLPNNSVLHTVDKLLASSVDTVVPDLNNPFIKNEKFAIYVEIIQQIPGPDAKIPINEKYRFRPGRYFQEIKDFFTHNRQIKRITDRDSIVHRTNTLPIIGYNEILTTQILSGQLIPYRHFDLLLRTILNTVLTIDGKHQWLQIPLSRTIYTKVQFSQTFDKITYQTLRIKNDPSYFFLIHLINFLYKKSINSLFSLLPDETLDTFNIILTAGNQAIIYNLGDLKHINENRTDNTLYQLVIRHINTLKLAGHADYYITTLDDTAYDKQIGRAHV